MAKILKFTDALAQDILAGRKTTTWRMFDEKELAVGDELRLVNSDSGEAFASAVVDEVIESSLGRCVEDRLPGAEVYPDKAAALNDFRTYNDDRVTLDTPVKVISFHLHG